MLVRDRRMRRHADNVVRTRDNHGGCFRDPGSLPHPDAGPRTYPDADSGTDRNPLAHAGPFPFPFTDARPDPDPDSGAIACASGGVGPVVGCTHPVHDRQPPCRDRRECSGTHLAGIRPDRHGLFGRDRSFSVHIPRKPRGGEPFRPDPGSGLRRDDRHRSALRYDRRHPGLRRQRHRNRRFAGDRAAVGRADAGDGHSAGVFRFRRVRAFRFRALRIEVFGRNRSDDQPRLRRVRGRTIRL